ncbi:MAG: methyl-accepting chemotaxis protein [Candidatus Eremiobacteraeota bacterium]|nr:methyl-accepting chemotaxis protein [Candidatus Eremiobacteraeota bacterium]
MRTWTIRQRLIASFGVILALMIAMVVIVNVRLGAVKHEVTSLRNDYAPGINQTTQIMQLSDADFALVERHALETNPAAQLRLLAQLRDSAATLEREIAQYGTTPRSEHRRTYVVLQGALTAALRPYFEARGEVLAMDANPATRAQGRTLLMSWVGPRFDALKRAIDDIVSFNQRQVVVSTNEIDGASNSVSGQVLAAGAIALIAAALCGFMLLRSIMVTLRRVAGLADRIGSGDLTVTVDASTRGDEIGVLTASFGRMVGSLSSLAGKVQESALRVNSSVSEIAATAKQQQATASETAATVTEIGATSREISATSKELVRTMSDVSTVAEHTANVAGNGQAGLAQMEETMRGVMDAAKSINDKLVVLNEKAGSITQVITTITKIADQTNLLSLNAAIEAEKAGEYGRGFSVVATEIRRLADQTSVATFDIERIVKEIQSAVSAGVMGMDKFSDQVRRGVHDIEELGGQFTEIIGEVQALAPRVEQVSEGMQAQAIGAEHITQALTQLSEGAQQTAESLRQSSLAIDNLNDVSVDLRDGLSGFTLAA